MTTRYNKEKVIQNEIEPYLNKIIKICNEEKIPIFFTLAASNSDAETKYETKTLSPDVLGVELKENNFPEFINVMNGFNTVPPRTILEMEY